MNVFVKMILIGIGSGVLAYVFQIESTPKAIAFGLGIAALIASIEIRI